ncbi:glycosyltransferase [Campylobacter coli]|uniref:glycosyltransferase n=1 Tax=Campylobacter coli TaxID=195 RepID=UPI0011A5BC11|nr:glycosyltransferase [Campylobacter coli]
MRIVDIINYFKESNFNRIVNLVENENIKSYCKISDDFPLPYSDKLQEIKNKTIVLVDPNKMLEIGKIFELDLAVICFCTKNEMITYTNLSNLFSRYKLEIINIQYTNLDLIAILAIKNINIQYNDEKMILDQKCEILSKELENYKGSRLKYKRLYENLSKELNNYRVICNEQMRSNEILSKELENYKGSRLKYKRLASFYEFKYTQLKQQKILRLFLKIQKLFHFFRKRKSHLVLDAKTEDLYKAVYTNVKLNEFVRRHQDKPVILLYGDINLNIVDGSSIWLSSIFNLAILEAHVIVFSKVNVKNNLVVSNFINKGEFDYLLLEPKDLNLKEDLSIEKVSQILNYIDFFVPNIQLLITRGIVITQELIKNNNFKYRLVPYLTDFYDLNEEGIQLKKTMDSFFKNTNRHVKFWLWQTQEMKEFVEKNTGIRFDNSYYFPPIVFSMSDDKKQNYMKKSDEIVIGYGGKIQPEWGILELILKTKELNDKGKKIKLLIVSSKISARSSFRHSEDFVKKIKKYLTFDFIEFYSNLNREQTLEKLCSVDYLYGFRPEYFEEYTLEISTKILEALVLEKPIICYPNKINQKLFGFQYPYFIKDINELDKIIENKPQDKIDYKLLVSQYLYENRRNFFKDKIFDVKNKKITIASHDYKFIDHFYSYLKSIGFMVDKDLWEWGDSKYLDRSVHCLNSSDVILCEWGLANAVWYSKNINSGKKLYIRSHLQEINQKAKKFGHQIEINNVEKNIFVSERVRDIACNLFSWNICKTSIINNYILHSDFTIGKNKKFSFNFGMVGITPQRKRLDRALDLMELVLKKYPTAKLYIKGVRPEQYEWMHAPGRIHELEYYYNEYKRIEQNILLKNAVIFDEYDNNMPEWYQKIDFILSPSDFESFHYALADGIVSGCIPIIWNWEESSVIYKQDWIINNEQEALKYIQEIIHNKDKINQIRLENRNFIINKYGYEKIYHQLMELLYGFK